MEEEREEANASECLAYCLGILAVLYNTGINVEMFEEGFRILDSLTGSQRLPFKD